MFRFIIIKQSNSIGAAALVNNDFDVKKFAQRLRERMEEQGYTVRGFADAVFLSAGSVSKYRNAKMEPERSTVELLAKHLQVNPVWLMGYDVEKYLDGQKHKSKTIPFAGEAPDKSSGYTVVSADEEIDLCLLVRDNGMINARIFEGDIAYIKKQSSVENGEIAAVVLDDTVTLKRIYMADGVITLHSENPTVPDRIFTKKEKKDIAILGKVIYIRFEVK